ncbi:MAG: hypothetical protein IKE74_04785 [Mogibacterium sp.]|nr:hypothetical protein [Mogibacterium sp.]
MEKIKPVIVILVVAALIVGFFVLMGKDDSITPGSGSGGGSSSSGKQQSSSDQGSRVSYDEELEGAELKFGDAKQEDFYGKWTATSGQSEYMYGNVDLLIGEDGKWKGNVAEENISGTWTYGGNSMLLNSENFNVKLSFTTDGKLIMQEDRDGTGEFINVVLTKK